jgi:hypothetical protein
VVRKTSVVVGETLEEKFESINRALVRLAFGSRKLVPMPIPPYPVSSYVTTPDENGAVLRYLFPCSGKISKGCIVLDNISKEGVVIETNIVNSHGSTGKSTTVKQRVNLFNIEMVISAGDMLEVSVSDLGVRNIWAAFLWSLSAPSEVKQFLVDELVSTGEIYAEESGEVAKGEGEEEVS